MESQKEASFNLGLIIGIVVGAILGMFGGYAHGGKAVRDEAIVNGAAEYKTEIDGKEVRHYFYWKKP